MRAVHIAGVGSTRFGKHPNRTLRSLGAEAVRAALRDAGLPARHVQAAYCSNALAPLLQGESGVGQHVMAELGVGGVPVVNVENACASGSTAVHLAYQAVAAGFHDMVIVIGVEKAVMPKGRPLNVGTGELDVQLGDIFPGHFAMVAQKHREAYGTSLVQMAKVSVKNHANGCLNPYAEFKKPVTVDQVLGSMPIADPLTLLGCCPNSDGAAAVLLCSADALKHTNGQPRVRVVASALTSGAYDTLRDITFWDAEERTARLAYEMAGMGPQDLSVVELHDAFTICEIVHYEGLGLCPRGEGGRLIDDGVTELTGRQPVNPSGGLLAKGHPIGASGVGQIAELTWQLRGQAGARQVPGARTGLAQMIGGSKDGDVRACGIQVLAAG